MDHNLKLDVVGPGTWFNIHTYGAVAKSKEQKEGFSYFMKNLGENFICKECQGHIKQYMSDNPLNQSPDYFIWTWSFHNAVNRRLGKKEVPYEIAAKWYLKGDIVCTDCGKDEKSNQDPDQAPKQEPKRVSYDVKKHTQVLSMM